MNRAIEKIARLQKISAVAGILGAAFCGLGFAVARREFYISYLAAFIFWSSLSLGCFYGAAIHYLTSGRWGFSTRRFLEAGYMTLPVALIFLIPLFFGLPQLYPWARPEEVSADKILQHRAGFENLAGFAIRALIFFGVWIGFAWRLRKLSLLQDQTTDLTPTIRIRTLAGPAIAIVPLTASFAFVDWAMTIEINWYSTAFPVIVLSGQILEAFAFVTLLLAWLRPEIPWADAKTFHDLANLLLAFVMFWTYVAFAQLLIVYSGDLPHETSWYLHRIAGNWAWLIGVIVVLNFVLPFFLLLFRRVKKKIRLLAGIALLVFGAHATETVWAVAPTFYPRVAVHWTDFAAWFGLGGIWLAVFCGNLKRHPLLARNDPRQEALIVGTAHAQ
jgi:hypothetical protein